MRQIVAGGNRDVVPGAKPIVQFCPYDWILATWFAPSACVCPRHLDGLAVRGATIIKIIPIIAQLRSSYLLMDERVEIGECKGGSQQGVRLGRSGLLMMYPFPAEGFVQMGIFVTMVEVTSAFSVFSQ